MQSIFLLALGGAAGTVARFGIGEWFISQKWSDGFPWHTFAINAAGSFLLGILAVACKDRPHLMLLLGTGFCGGFTTFSTFSLESFELLRDGKLWAATAYALGSVIAGILGVWLAMRAMGR